MSNRFIVKVHVWRREAFIRLPEELLEEWGRPTHVAYSFRGARLTLAPLRVEGHVAAVAREGEKGVARACLPAELAQHLGFARSLCLHPRGPARLLHPGGACAAGFPASLLSFTTRGGQRYILSLPAEAHEELGRPRFLALAPVEGGLLVEPIAGEIHKVGKVVRGCYVAIPRFLMEAWDWPHRLLAKREGGALVLEPPPAGKWFTCALCGEVLRSADAGAAHLFTRHGVAPPDPCRAARSLVRAGLLIPKAEARVVEERFLPALAAILARQRGRWASIPLSRICEEMGFNPGDSDCRQRVKRLIRRALQEKGELRVGEWTFTGMRRSARFLRLEFARGAPPGEEGAPDRPPGSTQLCGQAEGFSPSPAPDRRG